MELQDRIHAHAQFFASVAELIPAIYLRPQGGAAEEDKPTKPEKIQKVAPGLQNSKDNPTLEELRARLHAKIEEARSRRGSNPDDAEDTKAGPAKKGARADDDDDAAEGKPKKAKKAAPKKGEAGQKRARDKGPKKGDVGKKKARKEAPEKEELDFSAIKVSKNPAVGAPGTAGKKASKKILLRQAEKAKAKMDKLKSTPEGRAEAEKATWERMAQLAAGAKLHDDPALLKKALKREQARKKKSTKEWQSRLKGQQKEQKQRQAKRQEHIDERKQAKKAGLPSGALTATGEEKPKKAPRRPADKGDKKRGKGGDAGAPEGTGPRGTGGKRRGGEGKGRPAASPAAGGKAGKKK